MNTDLNENLPIKVLAQNWLDFLELLNSKSIFYVDTPRFQDYAISEFDPRVVINILISNDQSYFAQKEILFAGLTAWIACPHIHSIVQEAMILAGAQKLSSLERTYRSKLPQDPLLTDVASKLIGPGIDFYRDFYYPIGGLEKIIRARSPSLMKRTLAKTAANTNYMAEFMSIAHYHAAYIEKGKYFRSASVGSCCVALSYILSYRNKGIAKGDEHAKLKSLNPKNCRDRVNEFRRQATLIYGANTISTGRSTFLENIKAGTSDYKKHFHFFDQWIRRSIYAAENIIAPMFQRETLSEQVNFLPDVAAVAINSPVFDEYEILIIENAFSTREWRARNPEKIIKDFPVTQGTL